MRYIKLLFASVILVSMSACVTDNQSDLDMMGYVKTINIVGPEEIAFEQIDGSAQTKATSVSNSGALVFNWAVGDTLGIFPNKGNQVEFPITAQEGSTSASFDGGGWALRNNASYAAYYPFSVWNYFRNNKTVVMDYSGQVQDGNGSFAHLSAYDFLASAKTTPRNSTVTFQMDRQGSILYIDIVVPDPATITSLTISCDEAIFVEKAALDISGNTPVVTPIETKESLTLSFENTTTTEQNETVRAYMAVQPVDFSSKTVTATLVTDAGTYTAPVVSRVVNKGKAAFLRFSDSFTDGSTETTTPPNNEIWYTSTDGNIVEPAVTTGFGANIVSNTYENGKGVIRFDGPVTAIGGSAFGNYKCKTLATIEIPTSVTTIGGGAFTACEHLSWPDIPASVTKIGGCAFFGCYGFVDVVIPDTVTEFGESIFQACKNLRSITSAYSSADKRCFIVDGVLNSFAFAGLGDTYIFPDNITSIGNSALRNNHYSGNLVIGDNVTRIEIEAFAYMSYIKSIRIGNNVSYIGSSAFRCFGSRTRVELELPASLTTLGGGVFTCSLTKLTIHAEVPPTADYAILCEGDVIDNENPIEPYPIYVPAQSVEAYKTDQYWGAYADRIQAIPNAQPNNEIWYTSTDGNIVVPNNSNMFGATLISNTYKDGKGVMSFDGPVTMVGDKSYSGSVDAPFNTCRTLLSISLPESVDTIGDSAFWNCYSLQTVKMPSHLVYLGSMLFGFTDIRTINIPETDDISVGNPVGIFCYNLEEITGPYASIDHRCLIIENSIRAFAPAGLDSYTIEEGITEIGHGAFWGCLKGPKLIVFPSTLKVISNQSFIQCSMETLVFPEGLERIGYSAFYSCSSLISVTLPSTLSYLDNEIFNNCTSLRSFSGKYASADGRLLVDNSSVKAFAQGGLTEYIIPEGITYATDGFDGSNNLPSLESLTLPSTLRRLELRGKAITTLTSLATTPPSVSSSDYLYLPKVEAIYVPAGSIDAYKTASCWSSYADRIQAIPTSAGGGNEGTSEEAWN